MSYTYASFQAALAVNMAVSPPDPNFVAILPSIIDYAELRIQRDLDFLANVSRDSTQTFTANLRTLALPTDQYFITVQRVNVITPTATVPDAGTRNPLLPVSQDFLDSVYPGAAAASVPQYFAMLNNQTIIVGPWPDQNYTVEFVGTTRQPALYTNPAANGNFISLYLPDLYMAAAMIFGAGYMRNFGMQADDPRMAVSWESVYQGLLKSADVEEARVKMRLSETSSPSPPPAGQPSPTAVAPV